MEGTVKISVKTEKIASCNFKFDVMVPLEQVAQVFKNVRREYMAKAKLPGFRPGKIPVNVIDRVFGSQVSSEVTGELLQSCIRQALDDNGCCNRLIQRPDLDRQDYVAADGKPFEFTFTAMIRPELSQMEYKGLPLTKTIHAVSEKDVEDTIENFRKMSTNFEKVEMAAQENDMVIVDYEAQVPEDMEIDASANYLLKAAGSWMPLREKGRLPGIAAILNGKKAGDACDADIVFPEDFDTEALRGKTLKYHFDVKEIRKEIVPELDEAFANRMGTKSVEELRECVRAQLNYQAEQKTQNEFYSQIETALFDKVECELPEILVKQQVSESLKQRIESEKRRGATQEELTAKTDELEKEIREQVVKAFKREFILSAIVQSENLELTQNEKQIIYQQMLARERPGSSKKLAKQLINNGQFDIALHNARLGKAMQKIIELAQITEVQETAK